MCFRPFWAEAGTLEHTITVSNLSCFAVPPAIGATAAAAVQVRAWVCVVLIVIMRLLNLAVPILYKKVSNLFEQNSLQ